VLQRRAETVTGVGAHGVKVATAIKAEGEGGHGEAGGFDDGGEAGKWPVHGGGDQVSDELLGTGRQMADQQAGSVGKLPEPAEPAGPVVEGVVEVEQQGRTGFEQLGARVDCSGCIGHVVEHAEGVAEVLTVRGQSATGHGGLVEVDVG